MQRQQFTHGFVVELTGIRCLMEVQVTAEHFVRTFTRQHHLDAHRLDFARHQVHRGRGANGGNVIGFDVINHVANGVQTFLYGEVDLMVHGAQVVCHFLRGAQIR
ncbi:hypothetical protein D3C78_1157700 [compost metagenome]